MTPTMNGNICLTQALVWHSFYMICLTGSIYMYATGPPNNKLRRPPHVYRAYVCDFLTVKLVLR